MTKIVPAQFPTTLPCKIAFVGEAPADYESLDGKPFVGPSGKLFNSLLRMANIRREQCLVTNVFDVQLPENDVANWCGTTKEKSSWEGYDLPQVARGKWLRPEHEHHLTRLALELAKATPTVVVPLGGTALWAMTGFSNIMARRGAVGTSNMQSAQYKILPTFHPAFLIHQYKSFPIVVADLIKAVGESKTKEIITTPRELWIDPTIDDIIDFNNKYLSTASYISIDIETPYLKGGVPTRFRQLKCIGFSDGPHHAICIPFVDDRQINHSYWSTLEDELTAWAIVKEICENDIPKLGQNYGAFDAYWLYDTYGIKTNNYRYDTRLEHHALYPELRKDLGTLGALYAHEHAWKTLREGKAGKGDE